MVTLQSQNQAWKATALREVIIQRIQIIQGHPKKIISVLLNPEKKEVRNSKNIKKA
jgi:hypothetical protein